VDGRAFYRYGGATSCTLVFLGGQYLVLDAGTGLAYLPQATLEEPVLPLLLTHAHADHLLGLPVCPRAMRPGAVLDIYARTRSGLDCRAQVTRLLSPPLWPVGPEALPAKINFHPLPARFEIGPISVVTMEGAHPGGISLLRLSGGGKTVVSMSDCTITKSLLPVLIEFAGDCDLLLCDGQYGEDEWAARAGFGHSTWTAAVGLAAQCGAKRLRIVHHDPSHTDDALDAAEAQARSIFPGCRFARQGEVIAL